jgi:hypothetical protein
MHPAGVLASRVCRAETFSILTQVDNAFPYEWIRKKWREGFHVTSLATAGKTPGLQQWAVVMSRDCRRARPLARPASLLRVARPSTRRAFNLACVKPTECLQQGDGNASGRQPCSCQDH